MGDKNPGRNDIEMGKKEDFTQRKKTNFFFFEVKWPEMAIL